MADNLTGDIRQENSLFGAITPDGYLSGTITTNETLSGELSNAIVRTTIKDYNRLDNKPSIGGVVLEGDKSLDELNITNDKEYIFTQTTPSDYWIISHGLGKFPSVTVVDSAGTLVEGQTHYINENQIELEFFGAFAGKAYLN